MKRKEIHVIESLSDDRCQAACEKGFDERQ